MDVLQDAVAWLNDPLNWTGRGGVLANQVQVAWCDVRPAQDRQACPGPVLGDVQRHVDGAVEHLDAEALQL